MLFLVKIENCQVCVCGWGFSAEHSFFFKESLKSIAKLPSKAKQHILVHDIPFNFAFWSV